ncbi:MAG: hypothetical protein RLZZ09_621 [Pseudomonadota bacterium]|jgi:hypothetical protein
MTTQTEKLEAFLRDLTLSAVARNAEGEDIGTLIVSIDAAVRSRRIVDCVQFEELWEDKIDGAAESYLFVNFKLAPDVCEAAYDQDASLNELTWNLVLPNVNALDEEDRPENGFDWLDLGEVMVNQDYEGAYDCLNDIIRRDDDGQGA